jgi:F-type H+-transporting ATPase subunit delta
VKYKLLAQRYSRAILKLIDKKEYPQLQQDIKQLREICQISVEQLKILDSMLLSFPNRIEVGKQLTESLNFEEIWTNLIKILISKHRVEILTAICDELEEHILATKNECKVTLQVAHEHPEKTIEQIKQKVKKILNKEILVNLKINPEILGGFVAETDSLRIDGSIKNNLVKFVNMKSK